MRKALVSTNDKKRAASDINTVLNGEDRGCSSMCIFLHDRRRVGWLQRSRRLVFYEDLDSTHDVAPNLAVGAPRVDAAGD
jgi:hypothetical protein